ncbi:50S ribosomal protein L6 [Ignatzschineria cameli]|uniref:Large ribosomal subunit protein uL6 n=1 Tax=Ignatzschineria cameli TaxID=2182793 RepID=A0A2U2ART0_9GAMM|nr:50S ribosomal protein L6 [Ignatzschineria cameli]PWD86675.1 50S ribosomal protein L6 [Ignatzschineria cameli]PWD86972.1 50S ribosomal protein L6 [Ignatzschineria cameli]PWD91944.1 50S ribosomal protein L6 [Ignatzschineria cameli]PWD93469.1 50S ribosomal protein L6 [Ignatzschineria cameli]PWD94211.1 50S ribosomal protein L6 [Ignatzschineria cameli]
MSRVAKQNITVPAGVEITISGNNVKAKGPKGENSLQLHSSVGIKQEGAELVIVPDLEQSKGSYAIAGTMRSLVSNLVIGVSEGFERKLILNGVGYRAAAQGSNLNLTLGFSHPIVHAMPEGVTCETPTQTEVVIKGVDKQVVGQVAAKIRAYRPPEPYKGKGVRYSDEVVSLKEVKKK